MAAYEVRLVGCDEVTTFVMDLADAEAALVERVAALSRETSAYNCEPRMTIAPALTDANEAPE